MKYRYYSVFTQEKDYIDITFPDLKGCITFGDNLEQALHMSKEALEGYLLVLEDEKMSIPKPSTYQELQAKLNDNQQLQLISVDTDFIRRREENKAVSNLEI
ncbi:type II toxin-antitoxin system HicB family antitoxin [Gemella parahaemolysans]